jgi:hypothetical protein
MIAKRLTSQTLMAAAMALAACGGGGGSAGTGGTAQPASASMSSGTITAFGSVFVNGHEFSTAAAKVFDDDAGTSVAASAAALEVGMSVDVKRSAASSDSAPEAAEIHLHPLARGFVDASDLTAATLAVMGQNVKLTASTNFIDRRSCITASTPCTPVSGQSGLTATTGSGASAVAGNYVTVDGYLFSAAANSSQIVATLVVVRDAPAASASPVAFKAEGVVNAASGSSITIGSLVVGLGSATCRASGQTTPCAGAFSVGQVASVFGTTAPALPALAFAADVARKLARLPVQTAGAQIEIEGKVSAVTASPAALVVRGVSVDASGLPSGTALPAIGDVVEIMGTVSADGTSLKATALKVLHVAASAILGLEGDASGVAAGSTANTFVVSVLGQTIIVNANTRLHDESMKHASGATPFNITTFQTYLAASGSQHVLVRASADASGNLSALSLAIVKASTVAGLVGKVDATPAPVNSTSAGTPTTFAVHGIAVSADPAAIARRQGNAVTITAGDNVLVRGTYSAGTLTVSAPSPAAATLHPSASNIVIDLGVQTGDDEGCF